MKRIFFLLLLCGLAFGQNNKVIKELLVIGDCTTDQLAELETITAKESSLEISDAKAKVPGSLLISMPC